MSFNSLLRMCQKKNKSWAETFTEQDQRGDNWVELARRANSIPDENLQNSQFMQFVNKLATGELSINDGKLVENERNWTNEFLKDSSWAEQFGDMKRDNWAEQFSHHNWADEFNDEESQLFNSYESIWNQLRQEKTKPYEFQQENPYIF